MRVEIGQKPGVVRGTGSSNPSPSSRESAANSTQGFGDRLLRPGISHSRSAIARDIDEVLTSFPALRQKYNARAGGLSGGEQQMVAIVRALLSRPRCLLMDEPSAGLSPVMVNVLVDMILGLHERGLTILLVEQNVGVAAALADSAHVLQHGEIVFSVPLLVSSTRPRSCNPISDADRLCFSTEVGPHP